MVYTQQASIPLPTVKTQAVTTSTNHSANVSRATKIGGGKRNHRGGATFTAPAVPMKFNSVAGVNSQQTANNSAVAGNTANAQSANDVGSTHPGWKQSYTSSHTSGTTGGSRRRKSRKSKKSRKTRKSRRHKRRNTYKK